MSIKGLHHVHYKLEVVKEKKAHYLSPADGTTGDSNPVQVH